MEQSRWRGRFLIHSVLPLRRFSSATCSTIAGTLRDLQRTAERVISICAEHGFAYGLAHASVLLGVAMTEQGRGEEGLKQIQQGFAQHREAGAEASRSEFLYWLAKAYCATGRLDEALDTLDNALGAAQEHENLWLKAEIYRLKGEFLIAKKGFKLYGG